MNYLKVFFICVLAIFACASCSRDKSVKTLKVAATAIPQAEMLEHIKPEMKAEGIDLEVIVVDDYNIPNRALAEGDVDANFFQHAPYLQSQITQFKYPLVIFGKIHIEPMAIYSKKIKNLVDVAPGAKVGIPSDPSNQARALLLLADQSLLKLDRYDIDVSLQQVSQNPRNLKLMEIDAPMLARALDDVDLAVINTNFALQAGLSPIKDALAIESKDSHFINVLVIRSGDENREDLMLLRSLLKSEKLSNYIREKYQGAVIPIVD